MWHLSLKGRHANLHSSGDRPDIFIFATPRSGSTHLAELIAAAPGIKFVNEPLSLAWPATRRALGVEGLRAATVMKDRETRYRAFFGALRRNQVAELHRPFYWPGGRLISNRIVFKILHGAEDMIPWIEDELGGQVVLLLRHPIPTVMSHEGYPRLLHLLDQTGLRRCFSEAQIAFAEDLIAHGSLFERGIVDWCLQTVPGLYRDRRPSWTVVSYEDLTMHPRATLAFLADRLGLGAADELAMRRNRASRSTKDSDAATQTYFAQPEAERDPNFLIDRWREQVSDAEIARCFEILDVFGVDAYRPDSSFPAPAYRVPGIETVAGHDSVP